LDAVNNMFDGDNLSWSAGLVFNVPIGNRAAKSDLERTMLSYEKQLSDLRDLQRQTFINMVNIIYDLEAAQRSLLAAQDASRLQKQNLDTEEKKFALGLNTSYEVLQAEQSFEQARSSEIGSLIDYNKAVGKLTRARQGYISGGAASMTSLPAGLPAAAGTGAASGIDQSMIQKYSGSVPAGMDINSLKSMLP
jgi:outer membrane protein TolC